MRSIQKGYGNTHREHTYRDRTKLNFKVEVCLFENPEKFDKLRSIFLFSKSLIS